MRVRRPAVASLALVALAACSQSTTTSFSQSYRNPGYETTSFEKLMVIAVAQDQDARRAFETGLVAAISKQGGIAIPSIDVLPTEEGLTGEPLQAAVEAGGFDGVVITRLLSVDKDSEYTPPEKYHNPQTRYYPAGPALGYGYGGYYGYYGTTYAEVHTPGYFETSTTLKLETSLYSVATNELVWTGQSNTVDPESVEDARASITTAVAERLQSEGLIP